MDSFTQAVLGGAVGHAVGGRRLGRRAALWGAVAGTLPDLDVLAAPFQDAAQALHFHRGVTHGLVFSLVAGPLLAWALWRFERWRLRRRPEADPGTWRAWTAVLVLSLITHPLLDVFTIYGTQLLAPFSDRPFAIGSVFIIDPLYTLPLLAGLVVAVVRRTPRWATVGLAVSCAYLGWSVVAQQIVQARVVPRLPGAERVLVSPAPLQTLLWRVEVERDGAVESYRHTLLDPAWLEPEADAVPLVAFAPALQAARGVQTLRWFSRDWLVRPPGAPPGVVADARFGRSPAGVHLFRWQVAPDGSFRQLPFEARVSTDDLRDLAREALARRP